MKNKGGGSAVECCSDVNIGSNPSSPPHPECFPIVVPDDDMAYNPSGSGKITCMSLIRSTYGNNLDGTVPIMRQHVSKHFIRDYLSCFLFIH